MSRFLTIFSAIAKNEGMSISSLEKSLGASKGVLSRAIKHGTDIQSKWIIALVENYPHYNPEWILTGKGSMLKNYGIQDMHQIREEGEAYQLQNKITDLKEQIKILKTANRALKDSNDSLKEIKFLLNNRISVLEKNAG